MCRGFVQQRILNEQKPASFVLHVHHPLGLDGTTFCEIWWLISETRPDDGNRIYGQLCGSINLYNPHRVNPQCYYLSQPGGVLFQFIAHIIGACAVCMTARLRTNLLVDPVRYGTLRILGAAKQSLRDIESLGTLLVLIWVDGKSIVRLVQETSQHSLFPSCPNQLNPRHAVPLQLSQ